MVIRGTGDAADTQRNARPLKTIRHLYRIDRRDISYLRFILEAYDGMAVLTTRDAARGIVSVTIAPGCEALVDEVISALSRAGEIYIEPLPGEEPNIFARGRACVESS
ncbi:MAG: DUF4911 domain-containing protein [Desulfobacterales bacterium]|jgi:hypothetical protein